MDAELYTVAGAPGELFSLRTSLLRELEQEVILDDLEISMQGYCIEYDPDAFATESTPASLAEEEKRKGRILSGAFQSLV
jgi:poly-beta-1,6-N-acetyl-D-glucosamine synthase